MKNHRFLAHGGLLGLVRAVLRRMAGTVALGAALAVLAACSAGFGGSLPPAPKTSQQGEYDYLVGPGDTLNIIVWRNPDLSMTVPVRPDGKISTPLVDELVAQGKTTVEIARDIKKTLTTLVRDPVVSLLLALPFALRFTWAAVLLWTWISLMNPHKLAFGWVSGAPIAAIAAGAALVSLPFNPNHWRNLLQPVVLALVVFVLWMCLTTLMAFDPAASSLQLGKVLKIQLMTLVALVALTERRHIEWFVWANVLSIGFYGLKGGLFTVATGGSFHVWGPPGGFIEGNNELALALVVVLPLMNYLRLQSTRRWERMALMLLMGCCVVAVAGSQSRGALLALLAMAAMLWLRSHHKLLTGLAMGLASFAVLALMPESWEQRMHTIQTYQDDGSAMGRINAWLTNLNIARHHLTGGGFEIYTPDVVVRYAPDPSNVLVAHSIYFSVLGEHGFIGLVLFLLVWLLALRLSSQIAARAQVQPGFGWARDLALMCQVALEGYAVGGAFLSLAYFDLPYNLIVMLVITRALLPEPAPMRLRWHGP